MRSSQRPPAIVLAGASALGAYQAGVLRHVTGAVAAALPHPLRFDILSGTSAGGINAAALATRADDPAAAVAAVCAAWTDLRLSRVLRPSAVELMALTADLTNAPGRLRRALHSHGARGGLLDPRSVTEVVRAMVSPDRIDQQLAAGDLGALAVATTQISTGRAVVFHQSRGPVPRPPGQGGTVMVGSRVGPEHALASAAIPLLFPAVAIGDELYCDGGLRQLVPLSPALHLGARRALVINPAGGERHDTEAQRQARRQAATSPLYLAGKALNAMFVDGLAGDLDRLTKINRVLEAGTRRYGPGFEDEIAAELGAMGAPVLRRIEVVHLEPTVDLGLVAAEHVMAPGFVSGRGAAGRALRWLAGDDPARSGDLLSYLLFDGAFAARLIDLGEADARARHDDLVRLFG